LAFDEAAVSVRAAAVRAAAALVPNPLAAPLLRALLPGLAPLLWDRALAVRVALADLLLAVGCAPPRAPHALHALTRSPRAQRESALHARRPCCPVQGT
jgi:hypothetical protein